MAYVVRFAQHLTIDGVPLSTTAWEHLNLQALFGAGAVRGDNVVMPGAVGRRAVRRRTDEMGATLELAVWGETDWEGIDQTDPVAGLMRNLDHLHTNVVDPLVSANSVRSATITSPGSTLAAGVQVLGFEVSEVLSPTTVQASMDITIIGGRFR
jgi:hypothetical protein